MAAPALKGDPLKQSRVFSSNGALLSRKLLTGSLGGVPRPSSWPHRPLRNIGFGRHPSGVPPAK